MTDKSTTVSADKPKVPSNPNAVEWPSDPMGITSMFKKEGVRASGRVNGHKDKLKLFLATLDVLREHAIERYKAQVEINNETSKAAIDRSAEEARRAEAGRLQALEKAKQEVERLEAAAPSEDNKEGDA